MDTGTPAPGALADAAGPDRQVPRKPRRHGRLVAGAAVVALVVAAVAVVAATDPFGGQEQPSGAVDAGTARAVVREGPLSSQVNQSGTLSYTAQPDGAAYSVVNQAGGIYTSLPSAGQVAECGQVLYGVGESPVVLLCGGTPAYRDLSVGDSGADARELNANLVRLGYADRSELDPSSDEFTSQTTSALQRLQDRLGVEQTGSLDLGQAVFLPGPLRITRTTARLGTRAAPGVEIAQATSTGREVVVNLNASQQSQVKVGNRAQITLPDNRTTPGVVRRIGTVASAPDGDGPGGQSGGSGTSTATIPVHITLQRPKDAGTLDQAPVQVRITTAGVRRALIVPVTALVGQAGIGFAVEKVDAQGVHQLVPVTLGLFDDADGLVQVTGNLKPGDNVVVPAT